MFNLTCTYNPSFWPTESIFDQTGKVSFNRKKYCVLLKCFWSYWNWLRIKTLKHIFIGFFDSQLNFSVCSSTWTLIRTLFLVLLNHIGSYLYHLQSSQIKTRVCVRFHKLFNSTLLGISEIRHQNLNLILGPTWQFFGSYRDHLLVLFKQGHIFGAY